MTGFGARVVVAGIGGRAYASRNEPVGGMLLVEGGEAIPLGGGA